MSRRCLDNLCTKVFCNLGSRFRETYQSWLNIDLLKSRVEELYGMVQQEQLPSGYNISNCNKICDL